MSGFTPKSEANAYIEKTSLNTKEVVRQLAKVAKIKLKGIGYKAQNFTIKNKELRTKGRINGLKVTF